MPDARRDPRYGARFSRTDAVVLVVAVLATVAGRPLLGAAIWIVPFVVGHFFLFCNVVRMRTRYELIWSVAFLLVVVPGALDGVVPWPWVLGVLLPLTGVLSALEVASPRYHGIFAKGPPPPRPG